MATSKKRKTAVKKVAKVSQKRPKPAPPKKPIKSVRRSKPAPGSTRAGAAADSGPRYFWMFAFGADTTRQKNSSTKPHTLRRTTRDPRRS
jgi:outer membrane biosynthesis protein TonB